MTMQTAMPLQSSQGQPLAADPQTKSPDSPTLNNNAQAALMILLTAQMQSQTGETSILQNPQVVGILQNLVSQAGNPTRNKTTSNGDNGSTNLNELFSHPALSSVFGNTSGNASSLPIQPQTNWQNSINADTSQNNGDSNTANILSQSQGLVNINAHHQPNLAQRTALLDTPKRPSLLGQGPPGYPNNPQQPQTLSAPPSSSASSAPVISNSQNDSTSTVPTILANNLNNLLNAQNLSQLLGSITSECQNQSSSSSTDFSSTQRPSAGQRPVLLTSPPSQNINGSQTSGMSNGILMGYPTAPSQPQSQSNGPPLGQQMVMTNPGVQINQFAQTTPSILSNISLQQPSITTQSYSVSNQMANQQSSNSYMALVPPQSVAASQNPFLLNPAYSMAVPPPTTTVSHSGSSPAFVYGAPPIQPFGPAVPSIPLSGAQNIYGSYVPTSGTQVQPPYAQMSFGSTPIGTPANMIASYGAQQAFGFPPMSVQPTNISNSLIPQQTSMLNPQYPSTPPQQQMQSPPNTGYGLKRKLPMLPSPENSPDGPFIGQHSQGIGGHYADSYWRNRSQNPSKRQRF